MTARSSIWRILFGLLLLAVLPLSEAVTGQPVKLLPNDPSSFKSFGYSVAIDGNFAIVGALGDDEVTRGGGAVYIFEHSDAGWIQVEKIISSGVVKDGNFGLSVSISDNRVLVGAPKEDGSEGHGGVAYLFSRTPSGWIEEARFTLDLPDAGSRFGSAVSIYGEYAVVCSPNTVLVLPSVFFGGACIIRPYTE